MHRTYNSTEPAVPESLASASTAQESIRPLRETNLTLLEEEHDIRNLNATTLQAVNKAGDTKSVIECSRTNKALVPTTTE